MFLMILLLICVRLDYKEADDRGYFKLDLFNVNVYKEVKDELHLIKLMAEPNWVRLKER